MLQYYPRTVRSEVNHENWFVQFRIRSVILRPVTNVNTVNVSAQ